MAKFDIKSAYRILPIHPSERFLFGMHGKRQFFIDLCLAFGLRSASKIFNDFRIFCSGFSKLGTNRISLALPR